MKTLLLVFLLFLKLNTAPAQQTMLRIPENDSLEGRLTTAKADTNRVLILLNLLEYYYRRDPEMAKKYAQDGLTLSQKLNYDKGESACLRWIGLMHTREGRYPQALEILQNAYNISIVINNSDLIQNNLRSIGNLYSRQGEYAEARLSFFRAKKICEDIHEDFHLAQTLSAIGKSYLEQNILDSAFYFYNQNYKLMNNRWQYHYLDNILTELGQVHAKKGNDSMAMNLFRKSIPYSVAEKEPATLSSSYLGIASLFQKTGQKDSSILYAQKALAAGQELNSVSHILAATYLLSLVYENLDEQEALRYHKMATTLKDSLFNVDKLRQFQNLAYVEHQRKKIYKLLNLRLREN